MSMTMPIKSLSGSVGLLLGGSGGSALLDAVVRSALRALGLRHSVEEDQVESEVALEFRKAIRMGSLAFVKHLQESTDLSEQSVNLIAEYLKSPVVTDELSKLLDPGLEIFDEGKLAADFESMQAECPIVEVAASDILDAWQEFSKAFSFSSRSTPALREFLRASYEAGSFRAISNISDALRRIDDEIDLLSEQEAKLSTSIFDYLGELTVYKGWAEAFRNPEYVGG